MLIAAAVSLRCSNTSISIFMRLASLVAQLNSALGGMESDSSIAKEQVRSCLVAQRRVLSLSLLAFRPESRCGSMITTPYPEWAGLYTPCSHLDGGNTWNYRMRASIRPTGRPTTYQIWSKFLLIDFSYTVRVFKLRNRLDFVTCSARRMGCSRPA